MMVLLWWEQVDNGVTEIIHKAVPVFFSIWPATRAWFIVGHPPGKAVFASKPTIIFFFFNYCILS